jgi:hypothetical protein
MSIVALCRSPGRVLFSQGTRSTGLRQ